MADAITPQPQHRPVSYGEFNEDFYNSRFHKLFGSNGLALTPTTGPLASPASIEMTAEDKFADDPIRQRPIFISSH